MIAALRLIAYCEEEFPSVFGGGDGFFLRETTQNLVEYANSHFSEKFGGSEAVGFLHAIFPELERDEIAQFVSEDSSPTKTIVHRTHRYKAEVYEVLEQLICVD